MEKRRAKSRLSEQRNALRSLDWRRLGRWSLALVLLGAISSGAFWLQERLSDPRVLPFKLVRIDGQFRYLQRSVIEQAVGREIRGNFFTLDVERVRRAALALPWVESASVRRVWPQTLVMQIEEQVPLARWEGERLVNPKGVIFAPEPVRLPPDLVLLAGPDDSSREVVAQYLALQPKLARLGLTIERLQLDARGAWQLTLDSGLRLQLGSGETDRRVARFLAYYPHLQREGGSERRILEMDLRYSNGFTIRWQRQSVEELSEQKRTELGMQSARAGERV
ncbi:MAG: cell division protein FtsQ/DivIB [Gammaproteobacteria bacterium]|nr:cell division protein FtsQ/DivIB [Gammaproteobacteria bacterium]